MPVQPNAMEEILISSDDSGNEVAIVSNDLKIQQKSLSYMKLNGTYLPVIQINSNFIEKTQPSKKNVSNLYKADSHDIEMITNYNMNLSNNSNPLDDYDNDSNGLNEMDDEMNYSENELEIVDDEPITPNSDNIVLVSTNEFNCKSTNEEQCSRINEEPCSSTVEQEYHIKNEEQCDILNKELCSYESKAQCNNINEVEFVNIIENKYDNVNIELNDHKSPNSIEICEDATTDVIIDINKPGNNEEMQNNIKPTQGKKPLFVNILNYINLHCKQCEFSRRLNIHEKVNLPSCSMCRSSTMVQCKRCHELFNTVNQITLHLKSKCASQAFWNCPLCSFKFTNYRKLRMHIERIHPHASEQDFTHCRICERFFDTEEELNDHRVECDAKKKKPVIVKTRRRRKQQLPGAADKSIGSCSDNKCSGSEIASDSSASTELKIKEEKSSINDLLLLYCSKCNIVYNKTDSNKNNCFNCDTPMLWQCVKCEKRIKSYCGIYEHIKNDCERKYTCIKCNEKFVSEHDVLSHKNLCVNKVFNCNVCNFQTKNKRTYQRHLRLAHNKENLI